MNMEAARGRLRHILYIDAFDSFSNNIVGLLEQNLDARVTVVRIDDDEIAENLDVILKAFDAVVVGPGVSSPQSILLTCTRIYSYPRENKY